jgi:metal-responsive CopG/Arc/MetJ family transcriptional regulator
MFEYFLVLTLIINLLINLVIMTEIITFSISTELRQKVDRLRGDIARSKFISRALEDAIKMHTVGERNKAV